MNTSPRLKAALCAALIGTATLTVAAPGMAADAPMLGVHANRERDGVQRSMLGAVEDYEQRVGVDVEVANVFHGFTDTYLAPDRGQSPNADMTDEEELLAAGHTLLLSWRATDPGDAAAVRAVRAAELAAGLHDANLRAMAEGLTRLDGRVLLRFQWEMDQDAPSIQHIGTPAEFIAAWRHVHGVVSAIAPDVEWVWAPRANSFNKGEGQKYWPGAAYVDHIGGSAVPLASSGAEGAWRGPGEIFGGVADYARSKGRPLLVWVGVREKTFDADVDSSDRDWADDPTWKAGFFDELRSLAAGAWSDVLGTLVYYHAEAPKQVDFWVDTSQASRDAMRRLVCDDVFGLCGGEVVSAPAPAPTQTTPPPPAGVTTPPPTRAVVLHGDWDGDGDDERGWFRDGRFGLDPGDGSATFVLDFGRAGDIPVVGDWDGDGIDSIGVVRGNRWILRNRYVSGDVALDARYGDPGDIPVVGDWDGDGDDTIGVVRGNRWILRNRYVSGDVALDARYGSVGDTPVVGDYDGDGDDTIGVRQDDRVWVLRNRYQSGYDVVFRW